MVVGTDGSVIYLVQLQTAILEIVGKAQALLLGALRNGDFWVGELEDAVLAGITEKLYLPLQISNLRS